MAEYIERDKAINVVINNPYRIAYKTGKTIQEIKEIPAADVAPKSEVEELKDWVEAYKNTIVSMERIDEELRTKLENAKSEVAREIFEEIERSTHRLSTPIGEYTVIHNDRYAELKKKYIGEIE